MKYIAALLALAQILSLFGCSVKDSYIAECVEDTLDIPSVPCFRIEADIPQEAILTLSKEDGRCAVFSHEDYEITQQIFTACSWNEAFLHVTGRKSTELSPILAGNFPQEEYRCSWTVAGENGTKVCRCTIFSDKNFYYAVTIECDAEKDKEYTEVFSEMLASVSLAAV